MNISQSELARKIGVTPQAVQKWEKAKNLPRGTTLNKLADVLGVSPAYLQFGISETESVHYPSVEEEHAEYLVGDRLHACDDWPFTITREQFSQFSDEQLSLINRYLEILWESVEKNIVKKEH